MRLACAAALLALAAATVTGAARPAGATASAFTSMADAERDFAATAARAGIRAAFLEYLADDAVGFQPAFGLAKDEWKARPEAENPLANRLEWEPRTGDVSADGTLGWLSGPYTFLPGGDGSKASHGCYFSVWRRTADGPWRVFLDLGVSTPEPCVMPDALQRVPPRDKAAASTRETLLEMERYAVTFGKGGLEQTLHSLADPHLRVHLQGRQPLVGRLDALRVLRSDTTGLAFTPRETVVSAAGDLGVTYGLVERARSGKPVPYVRVWRPDQHAHWKVVFQTIAG